MNDIVIFGITGDLARKRLIPALAKLSKDKVIADGTRFIGFGRKVFSKDEFAKYIAVSSDAEFAARWSYLESELDDSKGYEKLALMTGGKTNRTNLLYISLPPDFQDVVVKNIFMADVLRKNTGSILAIEKPFGKDSISAKKLNAHLLAHINESQIYRVDHYAGKQEIMQIEETGKLGILAYLSSKAVNEIEINFLEKGTASGRGAFYDKVGALNDVCQNHMMHMLGTVLAAPYASEKKYRHIRAAVISLLGPIDTSFAKTSTKVSAGVSDSIIFGQYASFKKENGVRPDSTTETYFNIKNRIVFDAAKLKQFKFGEALTKDIGARWNGLKVTLKAGKALNEDMVSICFKSEGKKMTKNEMKDTAVATSCIVTSRHGSKDAYQTVFETALKGDLSRAISIEQIMAGWNYVENVKKQKPPLKIYKDFSKF